MDTPINACPTEEASHGSHKEGECSHLHLYRNELPAIVAELVEGCREPEAFHHLNLAGFPSREKVVKILENYRRIVFPGYFGPREMDEITLAYQMGIEVNELFEDLAKEISLSIRHECRRYNQVCTLCVDRGQQEALTLLKKLPALRKLLGDDVRAALQGDPAAKGYDEIIFSYPSIRAIAIYRLAHELFLQEVPLIPRMMTEYAHSLTGIDIHPGARIGQSFFIDHGTGVVIGETCIIGDSVRIYQGVTLGALSLPMEEKGDLLRQSKRHPTLEDRVTVYAGATILGGDTIIGTGSVIGGNVWLTHSVPPGTTVMIEPPGLRYKDEKKA
jgi:serine O-acetyltransferase